MNHTKHYLILASVLLPLILLECLGWHPWSMLQALLSHDQENARSFQLILFELRLPRAVLVLVVGASLGVTGAAMQGWLRNPLADPGLLGISASAALGAVLLLYYGVGNWIAYGLPLAAMAGAALAVSVLLAMNRAHADKHSLLLTGIAINALATSFIALALNFAPNPYAVSEIVRWLMGSFVNASWREVFIAAPPVALGVYLLLRRSVLLDALSLGDDVASSLGLDRKREQRWLILGVALCCSAAVAVSGSIGFVGLVVPHLLRPFLGSRPGLLLPFSALGGSLLLLACDVVVQSFSSFQEIKIGVVTSLLGAPFFFYLIHHLRRLQS